MVKVIKVCSLGYKSACNYQIGDACQAVHKCKYKRVVNEALLKRSKLEKEYLK